ncbi:hypothetical protein EYF80_047901 [Liparis tanakae]|uniref:Uncharacterized protein n=1 Tax=Liparis tanakae TaxID=230148 RepID=A0A4Z2FME2_9TELE|nr:hypothetical protein EYF80_047901 [Liparis tanakae]
MLQGRHLRDTRLRSSLVLLPSMLGYRGCHGNQKIEEEECGRKEIEERREGEEFEEGGQEGDRR